MRGTKIMVFAILATACGNATPSNFAGSYAGTLVSGDNACQIQSWTAGSSTSFQGTITQDGAVAQLTIPGSTGLGIFLLLVLGTNTFSGTVTGTDFTASFLGTKQTTQGACSYTVNTKLDITIDDKNNIVGTISYTPVTNGDASCGALNTCTNSESVTGSRTGP